MLNKIEPVTAVVAGSAFAVARIMLPVEEEPLEPVDSSTAPPYIEFAVLRPAVMTTFPPVSAEEVPEERITSPPTPADVPPIRILTEPLRPPVEAPEDSTMWPELAALEVPVESAREPLTPPDVAFEVNRFKDPVLELELVPERMLTEPLEPVELTAPLPIMTYPPEPADETEPADKTTFPPCAANELPTTRETEPAALVAEVAPEVTTTFPDEPEVTVPVLRYKLPLVPAELPENTADPNRTSPVEVDPEPEVMVIVPPDDVAAEDVPAENTS